MTLLVALMLGACTGKDADPPPDETDYPASALILVLDGVRTDEITSETPSSVTGVPGEEYAHHVWADLAPDAAVVRAAINPGVTITTPGHLQMLTGRLDPLANFSTSLDGAGLYRPELPTLFEEARSQLDLTEDDLLLLANTELLLPISSSLYPGLGEGLGASYQEIFDPDMPEAPVNDDSPVMEALKSAIKDRHPRLGVVNFHDVDRAGHYGGDGAYAADVAKLDTLVSELWRWLGDHEPGYRRNLLVIVTADHGRHRHDDDSGWKNHGDACDGCREVPLFVLGPDVRAGTEVDDRVALVDYGPTIAAHLGVDLPWTQGLPLAPLFDTLDAPQRTGDVSIAAAGGHVAVTRWLDAYDARAQVLVDGETLSADDAYDADGAVLFEADDGLVACLRQLSLPDGVSTWPWRGRCAQHVEGSWVDFALPEDEVGTNWLPAFADAPDGRSGTALWMASNHNPDGIGELGVDDEVGVYVRFLRDNTWSGAYRSTAFFPAAPALLPTGDGVVLAYATNQAGDESRYTRHIRIERLGVDDRSLIAPAVVHDIDLRDVLGPSARVERAALTRLTSGTVGLVMIGIGDETRDLFYLHSGDDGLTWSEPLALGVSGTLYAHLPPRWDGDAMVWAAQGDDGLAEVCRQLLDGVPECLATGASRIDSFVVDGGVVTASVDSGVATWEARSFTFP